MSNPPAIATSSKAQAPSGQLSPAQTQPGSAATSDSYGQRRSGSSFGAAARPTPTPRGSQQGRKQHKASKRFARVDDDAISESVSNNSKRQRAGLTTASSTCVRSTAGKGRPTSPTS